MLKIEITSIPAILFKESRETGLEPATSGVTSRCSNQLNYSRICKFGRNRTRTYDHLCVRQELYQLSYTPLQNKLKLYMDWDLIARGFL